MRTHFLHFPSPGELWCKLIFALFCIFVSHFPPKHAFLSILGGGFQGIAFFWCRNDGRVLKHFLAPPAKRKELCAHKMTGRLKFSRKRSFFFAFLHFFAFFALHFSRKKTLFSLPWHGGHPPYLYLLKGLKTRKTDENTVPNISLVQKEFNHQTDCNWGTASETVVHEHIFL